MNLQELLGVSDTFWIINQAIFVFHFLLLPVYTIAIFGGRKDESSPTKPNPLDRKS